jgi:hypothetical protein
LDADQREAQLLAQLDGVVAILDLVHHALQLSELADDALPVDDAGPDGVVELLWI